MAIRKGEVKFFKIRPGTEREQMALQVFDCIKRSHSISKKKIADETGLPADFVSGYLDSCAKKGFIKPSSEKDSFAFESNGKKVLGVGFRDDKCHLTVMDLSGKILDREEIKEDVLLRGKGKLKDMTAMIDEIASRTKLKNSDFLCVGVAVPEELLEVNPKTYDVISNGISGIFGNNVYLSKGATASGYADRDFTRGSSGKDILYMYSDVGIGVIYKKESIFEADEYSAEKDGSYLRPWNQFSMVRTTKDLVARGVGTEIVEMVKGDVDSITMDVVLKAADKKDELAEDLVKRSALALGVRVAYLVNMFNVGNVVFGGGTERGEGHFIEFAQESMRRFIAKDIAEDLKLIPGVLGKESCSVGAASLCRRELFMEV